MRSVAALAVLAAVASAAAVPVQRESTWSLMVLFDVSASMRLGQREAAALEVALHQGLVARLEPSDRVRIGVFAAEVRLSPGGQDPSTLTPYFRKLLAGDAEWRYGPSRLWDAVEAASQEIQSDPGRRVVVVVSDGRASGNKIGRADVAAGLRARQVELWVIRCCPAMGPSMAEDQLRAFAVANGGRVFKDNLGRRPDPDRKALIEAFSQVVLALRELGRS